MWRASLPKQTTLTPIKKQTFEKLIAAKWAWLAPIFFDATKLHE